MIRNNRANIFQPFIDDKIYGKAFCYLSRIPRMSDVVITSLEYLTLWFYDCFFLRNGDIENYACVVNMKISIWKRISKSNLITESRIFGV